MRQQTIQPQSITSNQVKTFSYNEISNLGILAHVDAGKTSLTERLLYTAGVIDESVASMQATLKPIHYNLNVSAASL